MSKIRYELEDGEIQLIDIPQELIDKIKIDSYNQALEDFVKMCDEAKYIMFKQYTVDMRDIREIKERLKK